MGAGCWRCANCRSVPIRHLLSGCNCCSLDFSRRGVGPVLGPWLPRLMMIVSRMGWDSSLCTGMARCMGRLSVRERCLRLGTSIAGAGWDWSGTNRNAPPADVDGRVVEAFGTSPPSVVVQGGAIRQRATLFSLGACLRSALCGCLVAVRFRLENARPYSARDKSGIFPCAIRSIDL